MGKARKKQASARAAKAATRDAEQGGTASPKQVRRLEAQLEKAEATERKRQRQLEEAQAGAASLRAALAAVTHSGGTDKTGDTDEGDPGPSESTESTESSASPATDEDAPVDAPSGLAAVTEAARKATETDEATEDADDGHREEAGTRSGAA